MGGDGADRGSAAGHPRDIAGGTVLGGIAGGVAGGAERAGQCGGRAGAAGDQALYRGGLHRYPQRGGNGAGDEPDLYLSGDHGGPAAGSSQQHPVLREDHQLLHAGHPAAPAQDHGLLRRCHGGRAKGLPDGGGADGQRAGRSGAGGVRQQLRREQHRVHRAVLDENRGLLAGVLSAAGGDTQRL